nr:hypothetical protein [Tanacetum cinerariifolium]
MTYTTSLMKIKDAQYDLPGIENMVPNIWSHVKVAYDKHALWGISHWREQRKTFYGYARGLQSYDVYSTKHILAVTRVEIMRKDGYGYLREFEVRRADNDLYPFKEGDFPRIRINDIKDMLILIVQNLLTNLSGNDVSEFAIALRMFTRSIVIQKRVEDLQLAIESYQKKINVTKPETTRLGIRKKDPYTLYQYPQGFIYVDTLGRNSQNQRDLPRDIPLDSVEVLSEIVTRWFTLMVQSALRRSVNEKMMKRFNTSAGNHVKEILLKLNLPDHRILKDGGEGT